MPKIAYHEEGGILPFSAARPETRQATIVRLRVRTLVHDAQSGALKFTVDGPVLAASSARVVAPKHTRPDTGSTLTVVNIPVDPGDDPTGRRTDRDDGLIQHVTPPTQDAVTAARDTVHDGSARRHARRDGRGRRPRRPASVHDWARRCCSSGRGRNIASG